MRMVRKERTYCLALDVDEETFQKLKQISAQGLRDLKEDLQTALKRRVDVFAAAEEYAIANLQDSLNLAKNTHFFSRFYPLELKI